jgi:transposase
VRTGTKAGKPVITWARDTAAITTASQLDGLYALAASLPDHPGGTPLTALDVLEIYKDQWIVEQRHRDLKQTLRVRPVFLHNDDRIEAPESPVQEPIGRIALCGGRCRPLTFLDCQ